MIRRQPETGTERTKVTFALPVDGWEGVAVAVVGDFNSWDPTATPLRKRRDQRIASVTLAGGRQYAFRYLAEGGRWFNDEGADGYQPNGYGGSDSVLDLTANR